jgi:SAM-dependent methyltransferase
MRKAISTSKRNLTTDNEILSEVEIRPTHLMAEVHRLFGEDVKFLLAHKDEFIRVPCPACGEEQSQFIYEKMELAYEKCGACETVFTNPRPKQSLLEKYYKNAKSYDYWNQYVFPESEHVRRMKIFKPRAERTIDICHQFGVAMDMFMEVGAAYGIFSEEIKKTAAFKRIITVEPTPAGAQACRDKGFEVIEQSLEEIELKDKMSVIASFEVIEHVFSPLDFIKHCSQLLAPGGLLILTCPNIKGFDIEILQTKSSAIDPEHLNYMHPKSIAQLMKRCGVDVIEILTPGKLDAELVRNEALNGQIDLSKQPFLQRILIDDWEDCGESFQEYLVQNRLSSHMWVVGQKPKNDNKEGLKS